MRHLGVDRVITAPASVVWDLLVDTEVWPDWGPSIRSARVNGGRLALGATGTITTVVGLSLPFEITLYVEGSCWGWKVAGIGATDHEVVALGQDRCRLRFGVPWPAAGYLVVCQVAVRRIEELALRRT